MCEWQTQSPGLMQIADAQEFTEPYFETLSINGQRNEIRPNPHLRQTLKRSPTAGAALGVLVAFPPNATGVTLASVGRRATPSFPMIPPAASRAAATPGLRWTRRPLVACEARQV